MVEITKYRLVEMLEDMEAICIPAIDLLNDTFFDGTAAEYIYRWMLANLGDDDIYDWLLYLFREIDISSETIEALDGQLCGYTEEVSDIQAAMRVSLSNFDEAHLVKMRDKRAEMIKDVLVIEEETGRLNSPESEERMVPYRKWYTEYHREYHANRKVLRESWLEKLDPYWQKYVDRVRGLMPTYDTVVGCLIIAHVNHETKEE